MGAEFQHELKALRREMGSMPQAEFILARQELFLLVQSKVLPKYGFKGSHAGVYKMMAAMGPFINDPDFVQLADKVNALVGIDSPPDKWKSLQQACERWDYVEEPS